MTTTSFTFTRRAALAGLGARRPRPRSIRPRRRRADQGRRPPLPVRHHGDQRTDAEGHRADAGRRAEQQGGLLGTKLEAVVVDPASNWPLFAEKARELLAGQGRRDLRLLDLRVPQVGAAGVRGAERPAVLPGAVRRRGVVARTSSTPAPRRTSRRSGGRVPDGRTRHASAGCCSGTDYATRARPTASCRPT